MIETSRKNIARYFFIGIFCFSQVSVNLLSLKIPIVDRLLLIAVCVHGFLLVYEFIFKKTMSVTGAIIPYGEKSGLRLFLFAVGCVALVYGYRAIYVGLSFM